MLLKNFLIPLSDPERFCRCCRELASQLSVLRQVKPFRHGHLRDQTGRVPCQGLDLGDVIAKHPPLSDFALRLSLNFRADAALGMSGQVSPAIAFVV